MLNVQGWNLWSIKLKDYIAKLTAESELVKQALKNNWIKLLSSKSIPSDELKASSIQYAVMFVNMLNSTLKTLESLRQNREVSKQTE